MTAMTIAMAIPGTAPNTATPTKQTMDKPIPSWMRYSRRRSATSTMAMAEAMTTAASAVLGMCCSRLGQKSSMSAMASARSPVSWVLEPEASATAVRGGAAADRESLEEAGRDVRQPPGPPSPGSGRRACAGAQRSCATARWYRQRPPVPPRPRRPAPAGSRQGRCRELRSSASRGAADRSPIPRRGRAARQGDHQRGRYDGDQDARDARIALEEENQRSEPPRWPGSQDLCPANICRRMPRACRSGPASCTENRTASGFG